MTTCTKCRCPLMRLAGDARDARVLCARCEEARPPRPIRRPLPPPPATPDQRTRVQVAADEWHDRIKAALESIGRGAK